MKHSVTREAVRLCLSVHSGSAPELLLLLPVLGDEIGISGRMAIATAAETQAPTRRCA